MKRKWKICLSYNTNVKIAERNLMNWSRFTRTKSFVLIVVGKPSVIIQAKCIRLRENRAKNVRGTVKRVAVANKQGVMRTAILVVRFLFSMAYARVTYYI